MIYISNALIQSERENKIFLAPPKLFAAKKKLRIKFQQKCPLSIKYYSRNYEKRNHHYYCRNSYTTISGMGRACCRGLWYAMGGILINRSNPKYFCRMMRQIYRFCDKQNALISQGHFVAYFNYFTLTSSLSRQFYRDSDLSADRQAEASEQQDKLFFVFLGFACRSFCGFFALVLDFDGVDIFDDFFVESFKFFVTSWLLNHSDNFIWVI